MINRFALGLSEGGVLTCTIVLIRAWFTKPERARANTVFLLSLAIGPMIANPISGFVLSVSDWRTMFLLEAAPGLLWGGVWLWAIADSPAKAAWLPASERARLMSDLAAENAAMPPRAGHWLTVLYSRPVILLVAVQLRCVGGGMGCGFWLPSVVKETGASIGLVGVLSALPYAAGAVMMVLVARSSDRRGERKFHMIAATSASGIFLFCAQFATGFGPYAAVLFLTLSIGAFLGRFGPFWTLPSEVLPISVAGVGIGLINGAGNLGGAVGPVVFGYVRDTTGSLMPL